MVKKHKVTIVASAISCLVGALMVYAFLETRVEKRDNMVKDSTLLTLTVGDHTKRLATNDEKWVSQAIKDANQDEEIERVQSTHKELLAATQRTEANQKDLERKMEDGFGDMHKYQLEQTKITGELIGHIKSVTEITETR